MEYWKYCAVYFFSWSNRCRISSLANWFLFNAFAQHKYFCLKLFTDSLKLSLGRNWTWQKHYDYGTKAVLKWSSWVRNVFRVLLQHSVDFSIFSFPRFPAATQITWVVFCVVMSCFVVLFCIYQTLFCLPCLRWCVSFKSFQLQFCFITCLSLCSISLGFCCLPLLLFWLVKESFW